MTITIPTPSTVFAQRKAVATTVDLAEGSVVRPGLVEVIEAAHDGVVKSKHLAPGQHVRPWVRDQNTNQWRPMGAERIVGSVQKVNGGAEVKIVWASPHATETKAASYRWFDADLVGAPVVVSKPGFVAVR